MFHQVEKRANYTGKDFLDLLEPLVDDTYYQSKSVFDNAEESRQVREIAEKYRKFFIRKNVFFKFNYREISVQLLSGGLCLVSSCENSYAR
jgi:hypothetical protein